MPHELSSGSFLKPAEGRQSFKGIDVPTIESPKGGGAIKSIDEKFSVNTVNGTSGISHTGIASHHARVLESIETAHQTTRGRGIVKIDHTYRHILRQTLVHQRREEDHRQERKRHHAEAVNVILTKNATLAPCYLPDLK